MIRLGSPEWFRHVAGNALTALGLLAVAVLCATCAVVRGSVGVSYGTYGTDGSQRAEVTLRLDSLEGLRK